MGTSKKHNFKTTTIYVSLLFCFSFFVSFADATHQSAEDKKPGDLFTNNASLSDEFFIEWKVDEQAQCIEFKLNVAVDQKGWVLLGFMPASKNSTENTTQEHAKIQDSTGGDFVVTWLSSASNRTTLDLNTIKTEELQIDDNSTRVDYQVTAEDSEENSTRQVLHITRKLDTRDPQDIPITDQPLWVLGAYGTSDSYFTEFTKFKDQLSDNMEKKKVIFVEKIESKTDNTKAWHKMLKEQVKKHWIGVVIGVSALLTVMIVAMVYLCFRKGKVEKAKKIKMTFYKDDEDDEARVAFLHSRT